MNYDPYGNLLTTLSWADMATPVLLTVGFLVACGVIGWALYRRA